MRFCFLVLDKIASENDHDAFLTKYTVQHLLENDALKYKSRLRRRKKNGHGELFDDVTKKANKKYCYEDETACKEEEDNYVLVDKISQLKSSNIMSEFMTKRKNFFRSDHEEDNENEIVYE
jgi:hypothetical protein